MNGVSVSHYLSGMAGSITRQAHHAAANQFPFVTISRQTGAGGRTLARELVRQIDATGGEQSSGWAIFDRAMCESIMDDPRLGSMLQDLLDERYRNAVQEFVHTLIGEPAQDLGYARLAEVQRQVAKLGKVVFVGRGASCVTRDLPLGVHVRLVAPAGVRQNRMAELLDVDAAAALKEMERSDGERERLIRNHFAADAGDPENYDMTFNTARVAFGQVAQSVLALVRARQEAHERKASTS